MKSWRTTVAGVLGALVLMLPQVLYLLDADESTVFNIEIFLSGLGMLGIGWFARDNGVTSKEAGAEK